MITRVSKIDDQKFPTGSFAIELDAPTNFRSMLFLLQTRYADCAKILAPLTPTEIFTVGFRGNESILPECTIIDSKENLVGGKMEFALPSSEQFTGVGYAFEGQDVIRIGTTNDPKSSDTWDFVIQVNGEKIIRDIRRALLDSIAKEWSINHPPIDSSSTPSISPLHSRSSGGSLDQ